MKKKLVVEFDVDGVEKDNQKHLANLVRETLGALSGGTFNFGKIDITAYDGEKPKTKEYCFEWEATVSGSGNWVGKGIWRPSHSDPTEMEFMEVLKGMFRYEQDSIRITKFEEIT